MNNNKLNEADKVFLWVVNQLRKIDIKKEKERKKRLKKEYKEKYNK